ncbi:hypothetical protein AMATHDRAFT_43441 [Amanita thiersii Skay4041]|uniref:AB hydrolase-1 domain-containing protein n=1 Tax=Amanita thiersii Skay4041 TaxID=703135 RepID=A0A2A9NEJ1_9AGAR|nr:hypothetical protein AMATHDRAFT_43441 [Amanita thiersii Skay4041]
MGPASCFLVQKYVKSMDGTQIYADSAGDPKNPAIVLIHGFSLSSLVFDPIFDDPAWTRHVYLVRYDVRGHGRSGKPTDEAAWESKRFSEDFDAVLQAFNLTKPYIAGWSLGASFLADILSFHLPSCFSGVINITGIPHLGPILTQIASPQSLGCLPPLLQTTDVDAYQEAARRFVEMCSDNLSFAVHQAWLGNLMIQPRLVTQRLMSRTQDESGFLRAGRESDLPLLVIVARKDKIIQADEVLRALKGWRNRKEVVMQEADHTPWVNCEEEFREAVLSWIKEWA